MENIPNRSDLISLVLNYRGGASPIALWRMIRDVSERADKDGIVIPRFPSHIDHESPSDASEFYRKNNYPKVKS